MNSRIWGAAKHLQPIHTAVVTAIVCLAIGHAVAGCLLFLLAQPLALAGLQLSALYWTVTQWSLGILLTVLAFLRPDALNQ
jgi:hypothetical protein